MKEKMSIKGGIILIVGLVLYLSSGYISIHVFQEAVNEAQSFSILEFIQNILGASALALTIYNSLQLVALVLMALGLIIILVGLFSKEKKIKSFKKRKVGKIQHTRVPNRKAKAASFFVTGWGRKNRRPKKLRLKASKRNRPHQALYK
jgi:hypothetical protein